LTSHKLPSAQCFHQNDIASPPGRQREAPQPPVFIGVSLGTNHAKRAKPPSASPPSSHRQISKHGATNRSALINATRKLTGLSPSFTFSPHRLPYLPLRDLLAYTITVNLQRSHLCPSHQNCLRFLCVPTAKHP